MKIHQHNAGHMTKMAVMSIYGKNTLNIFFQRTIGKKNISLSKCHRHTTQSVYCKAFKSFKAFLCEKEAT